MVLRGQFLERATLIRVSPKITLEGLWHRGARAPAVLLIPPAPGDGSMDAAALNELAFAFSRAGHPSLRFNFAGVGASQGRATTAAQRLRDARAARKLLIESSGLEDVVAIGYRSGATTALSLANEVERLVLVSPPADLEPAVLEATQTPVLLALAEADPSRGRWGEHCARTGDLLAVVSGADPVWNRGLPQLAAEVVAFVEGPSV